MRGVCFVHVLFHHVAKRPNGRLAQVLGTPVKFPSDSRAIAIPWHRSSSSQKALWCRGALRVGGVRWAVEVFLGLSPKLLFCNPFLTSPKPDLLQLSLPQPGHQHLLHCALRLGSFGTSWITCTSLIPWATSCSPKTAIYIYIYIKTAARANTKHRTHEEQRGSRAEAMLKARGRRVCAVGNPLPLQALHKKCSCQSHRCPFLFSLVEKSRALDLLV